MYQKSNTIVNLYEKTPEYPTATAHKLVIRLVSVLRHSSSRASQVSHLESTRHKSLENAVGVVLACSGLEELHAFIAITAQRVLERSSIVNVKERIVGVVFLSDSY